MTTMIEQMKQNHESLFAGGDVALPVSAPVRSLEGILDSYRKELIESFQSGSRDFRGMAHTMMAYQSYQRAIDILKGDVDHDGRPIAMENKPTVTKPEGERADVAMMEEVANALHLEVEPPRKPNGAGKPV